MTRLTEDRGRNWLPLALAFLLGLFIGWWVIGWTLWPVTYTNALPPDLRADEKEQYLVMTADSYAATSDLKAAQERTATWPKDALARDLSTLRTRLTQENPAEADRVQRLASALGMGQAPAPAAPAPAAAQPGIFQRLCPAVLWVLLALAGIVALVWLWRQWRERAGGAARPPVTGAAPRQADATSPADIAAAEESRWVEPDETRPSAGTSPTADTAPPPATELESAAWQPAGGAPPAATVPAYTAPYPKEEAPGAASSTPEDANPAPAEPAAPAAPAKLIKVGEFLAAYHAGEPDYDEAFDIKDTSGAVMAQCGVSLTSPVGRGGDQAAALQVWMWEKNDQFTQVQVLMSENAYKDTALREQLAEDYPALPIRQGSEFDMQTHGFLMHGIVERVIYEEGEEVNRIFNHLAVRLRVFQKDRA